LAKRIAFIVPDTEKNKVYELFKEEFKGTYLTSSALSFEELEQLNAEAPIDAIIIDWENLDCPNYYFERISQDPRFSICPIITYFKNLEERDLNFFKEYSFKYLVNIGLNLQKAVLDMGEILKEEQNSKKNSIRQIKHIREFFHALHNSDFTKADQILETHIKSYSSDQEIVYYCGLTLKTQKNFKESVKFLAHGMNISRKKRDLDCRFLHLLGNVFFKVKDYEQAYSFLDAAERVSSLNLRRKFILGQLCYENKDHDEALTKFLEIHDQCPEYPGIHGRIVELKYPNCENIDEVDKLGVYIGRISERKLIKVYKNLKSVNKPVLERRLLDLIIREFSKYAEKSISRADFYGAVKYYNHIKKIIEPSDLKRNRILLFCFARLYVKAGDYSMAERYLKELEEITAEDDKNVRKLKMQIVKGRDRRKKRSAS
jgi:tetratricopeptide (TPR) repeat protein